MFHNYIILCSSLCFDTLAFSNAGHFIDILLNHLCVHSVASLPSCYGSSYRVLMHLLILYCRTSSGRKNVSRSLEFRLPDFVQVMHYLLTFVLLFELKRFGVKSYSGTCYISFFIETMFGLCMVHLTWHFQMTAWQLEIRRANVALKRKCTRNNATDSSCITLKCKKLLGTNKLEVQWKNIRNCLVQTT
jgi:hypothetical protein